MWNTGQVQQGEDIRLIPVAEVIYFKAGAKYTAVITRQGESLTVSNRYKHLFRQM